MTRYKVTYKLPWAEPVEVIFHTFEWALFLARERIELGCEYANITKIEE